jgi:biopolymer transport protein ExbD
MNLGAMGTGDLLERALVKRSNAESDASFDITAMIDLVFMMNIYFLVTFIGAAMDEVDLPAANHAAPLDGDVATVITVVAGADSQAVTVYLGEGRSGPALTDPAQQEERIGDAVDKGLAQQKTAVLIKAEKGIRLREMGRLAAAAAREHDDPVSMLGVRKEAQGGRCGCRPKDDLLGLRGEGPGAGGRGGSGQWPGARGQWSGAFAGGGAARSVDHGDGEQLAWGRFD